MLFKLFKCFSVRYCDISHVRDPLNYKPNMLKYYVQMRIKTKFYRFNHA
jgi:hypothetical protein